MTGQRHNFTLKRKQLAASMLAQKIGYLKVQDFTRLSFFDSLPTQEFGSHRVLRPHDELFIVKAGVVEIWHPHHDMLVSELGPDVLFGEMSLLGQTMLGCKAIAGREGATVAVMDIEKVTEWIQQDGLTLFQELGPRLGLMESEHYRAAFQTVYSRLAGLLLELADATSTVKGYTQEDLAEQLAAYRETVTNAIRQLRRNGFIEVGRKRITIVDKRALKELSQL